MSSITTEQDFAEAKRAHQAKEYLRAETHYKKVLSKTPSDPQVLYLLGSLYFELKKFSDAQIALEESLALRAHYLPGHTMLGAVYSVLGAHDKAVKHFRIVSDVSPEAQDAQHNLAKSLLSAGRHSEAIAIYQRLFEKFPNDVVVVLNLAGALESADQNDASIHLLRDFTKRISQFAQPFLALGNLLSRLSQDATAGEVLEQCLLLHPDHPQALIQLGSLRFREGNFAEAEKIFRKLSQLMPQNASVKNHLINTLLYVDKLEEAATLIEGIDNVASNDAETLVTCGLVLQEQGKSVEAAKRFKRATELKPNLAEAWSNLGMSLQFQADGDAAIECYDKAIDLKPSFAGAWTNKSQSLLAQGKLKQGWGIYRHRFDQKAYGATRRGFSLPIWDGEQHENLKLLIWTDQGIGDELLYSSMIPDLQKKGVEIVLECSQRLIPLFKRSFSGAHVVERRFPLDPRINVLKPNAHTSLAELGSFFRQSLSAFPARQGFLQSDPSVTAAIRARYETKARGRPIVGVSWKSENPRTGKFKSVPPRQFRDLLQAKDAYFVSLQYGEDQADIDELSDDGAMTVFKDLDINPLSDIDAFAAQVAALDLVVTVSNTTAHIAGGLNVPVWVLVPKGQGMLWYWFFEGAYSPWYASMRLFRQSQPGSWTDVINSVALNLKQSVLAS